MLVVGPNVGYKKKKKKTPNSKCINRRKENTHEICLVQSLFHLLLSFSQWLHQVVSMLTTNYQTHIVPTQFFLLLLILLVILLLLLLLLLLCHSRNELAAICIGEISMGKVYKVAMYGRGYRRRLEEGDDRVGFSRPWVPLNYKSM